MYRDAYLSQYISYQDAYHIARLLVIPTPTKVPLSRIANITEIYWALPWPIINFSSKFNWNPMIAFWVNSWKSQKTKKKKKQCHITLADVWKETRQDHRWGSERPLKEETTLLKMWKNIFSNRSGSNISKFFNTRHFGHWCKTHSQSVNHGPQIS